MRNKDCTQIVHKVCGGIAFRVLTVYWRRFVNDSKPTSPDVSKFEHMDGSPLLVLEPIRCGSCKKQISSPTEITWRWTK